MFITLFYFQIPIFLSFLIYLCLVGKFVLNHFPSTLVHFLYCQFMCTSGDPAFIACMSPAGPWLEVNIIVNSITLAEKRG